MERKGPAVNHIRLDGQDEAVKQFFLSLPVQGSVLELEGHAVACILPVLREGEYDAAEEWTEERNARRCALIDLEIAGTLTPEQAVELQRLQREMLRYRRRAAPLPLDDARRLHQRLLAKAGRKSIDE